MSKIDMGTNAVDATFQHEFRTQEIMLSNIRGNYTFTDFVNKRNSTAVVDGFVALDGLLLYAVEQKSRNITATQLDEWDEELIVNAPKLIGLQQFAKLANMPKIGRAHV